MRMYLGDRKGGCLRSERDGPVDPIAEARQAKFCLNSASADIPTVDGSCSPNTLVGGKDNLASLNQTGREGCLKGGGQL